MNANDIQAMCVMGAVLATFAAMMLMGHLSRRRDQREEMKKRTAESIWGPRGHFNVWQEEGDLWTVNGVLTDDPAREYPHQMKSYSGKFMTKDQAVEHAKVLAGISPFGPEGILQTHPVPNRRGLVAHSRAKV